MSIQEQEKDLRRKAQLYVEYNKDKKHSLVISQYLQENNFQKLKDLLWERLSFGTAGLRGSSGPGLNQMNSLVVLQTTQGVISVLHDQYNGSMENWKDFGVVIGYDHRHESRDFAHLISGSFIGKGIKVYLFRNFIHTPMIPFSVTRLKALCGIMITASHNPKNDNGYKLYWQNGCQIIPPIDKKIANAILDNLKPWNWNPELATQSIDPEFLIQEYFSKISSLKSFDLGASKVSFCYTAMHGVGYPFAKKAFEVFGLGSKLVPVLEQVKKKFIMKRLILILNFQLLYIPIQKKRAHW